MSDSLGFLIADVSRLMRRRFDERTRRIGVTRAQWQTLTVLSRHEGSNQGALAEFLDVEPITLCRMIDRLEESGLVERRRDPADRRAWRIYLTESAQPVLAQIRAIADELFRNVLDGVSEADRAIVAASLTMLRNNLNNNDEPKEAAHG
jgi:DNA-binding MarR family transcriptional regulator